MKKATLLLPLLFVVLFPKATVLADEKVVTPTVSPTPMTSNYMLPYPGILPDNPLYVVKTFRDNVVAFFISDPLKKSAFYLLQSDKRVESAAALLQEGGQNAPLAQTTLSKSTNYFQMAIDQARLAQKSGEDTAALVSQLSESLTKHELVVAAMVEDAGSQRKIFISEQQRLDNLQKSVSQLSLK